MLPLLLPLLAHADPSEAAIGPVPLDAFSDELFWSHVTFTPILRAADGVTLETARVDVTEGEVALRLTAGEPMIIDWSQSRLSLSDGEHPLTFHPDHKRRTATESTGEAIEGTVKRADGAPLITRLQVAGTGPQLSLAMTDATATVLFGMALDTGVVEAHCTDLKQRRREGWLNVAGGAVLTTGLAFTSLRIYGIERETLGTTVPTLPTGALLGLTGAALITTGVMGGRIPRLSRDFASQCEGVLSP